MVKIIQIYDKNIIDFSKNGRVLNDTLSCLVTEELNGMYELKLEHPIDKIGKWQELIEGNIIKAPTPRGEQLFRIYRKRKTMKGIFANARHIFYDLLDNFLEDVRPTNLNGGGALDWILSHTQYPHQFTGLSDIETINSAYYMRKNPVKVLIGNEENSFVNRWGGELLRDNFTINIKQSIGEDRGFSIRHRKNLLGLNCDVNLDSVITRVMPTGLTEDNQILILPEKYIDSPLIENYPAPKIKEYHYQDIKVSEELTVEQAYELLRQKANELFTNDKIDIPPSNTTVDFIELTKTSEYKHYKVLQTIYLGDTVTVHHEELGVNLKGKAIKYVYNSLLERYEYIEIGDFKPNVLNSINKTKELFNTISEIIKVNKNDLQKAIEDATQLLTTALGGYVIKRNGELLIMDTEDANTATEVWRWNLNGLGYSGTGINGPYETAITMDGRINGKFITVEKLSAISANLGTITAGVLQSSDGVFKIDLTDSSKGMELYDNDELVGAITGETGAVFPTLQSEKIVSRDIINTINEEMTIEVGEGQPYSTITQAIVDLFGTHRKTLVGGIAIRINITGALNENAVIEGFNGSGSILVYFNVGAKLNGSILFKNNTVNCRVQGADSSNYGLIKAPGGVSPITNDNSVNLYLFYLNLDANGATYGVYGVNGGRTQVAACDIVNCTYSLYAYLNHEIISRGNRGNATYGIYACYGGKAYITNLCPKGATANYDQQDGFIILNGTPTPTDSSYSTPPVTEQTFKQVFTPAEIYTVSHDTTIKSSYYGATATQNRWDSSMDWKDGVFKFGSDIYNFFNGGTNIVVKMRIRRKNSSHGASTGVIPKPYGWSASFNAVGRGEWTSWVTVPSSLFTASGALLKLYSGVQGSAGYAIFDACEVEVTVTKTI